MVITNIMENKRVRRTIPDDLQPLVLEYSETATSFQLATGTVIDRTLITALTASYGADYKLQSKGGRFIVHYATLYPPELNRETLIRIKRGDIRKLPDYLAKDLAPSDHGKWLSVLRWAAKCLSLARQPRCVHISDLGLHMHLSLDMLWGTELSMLLTNGHIGTCNVYVRGAVVIVVLQIV